MCAPFILFDGQSITVLGGPSTQLFFVFHAHTFQIIKHVFYVKIFYWKIILKNHINLFKN